MTLSSRVRPKFSTLSAAALAAVALLLIALAVALDRPGEPSERTVVTVRLWDEQAAAAYRESFAAFARLHPDIDVRTDVVAYSTYFDTLRTDVAGGSADDIFWLSNAYLAGYADSGRLMDVGKPLAQQSVWDPAVADQFTRNGVLWAVPQLTDAGIALYYNADLLAAAGVDPQVLNTLKWSPDGDGDGDGDGDTLRPLLKRLTDTGAKPPQWGYNAANDLQGIYLNYIGSGGGVFQRGDRFAFDNPAAVAAFRYLVGLVNTDRVAPPASDTNDNGDFSRNQFLQGRMALFQSGTYNLAAVAAQAQFHWGVAMLPAGPAGRVSVTNGIAAAGNAASPHPDAVRAVLAWMGGAPGNRFLGAHGAAVPAVLDAQRGYFDYWAGRHVDVRPFFAVLAGRRIAAPGGAGFPAGSLAIKPYFDEMFLGRRDVATSLTEAQQAANQAATR